MTAEGISRRLARLEASHHPPCEACGFDPNAPITAYSVEWMYADEPDEPGNCEGCGRADRIVVTWGDEDGGGRGPS